MTGVRAAVVQMNSTEDVDRNRETADRLVRAAAADGARLIVLPERWNLIGRGGPMRAGGESLDGPAISWARETARELAVDLVAGSIGEVVDGRERLSNTSVHVGPDGEIRAAYRKLHLFDVEVGGTAYRESDIDEPGSEVVASRLDDGTGLGLSVCYDLRFPELYRELSAREVRIITVPSAFTLATTREHWEILLRARAIENQAFVLAPNQVGVRPPGNEAGGRSMIVDPWGLVLAQCADHEGYAVGDLDFAVQDAVREKVPALRHRRLPRPVP